MVLRSPAAEHCAGIGACAPSTIVMAGVSSIRVARLQTQMRAQGGALKDWFQCQMLTHIDRRRRPVRTSRDRPAGSIAGLACAIVCVCSRVSQLSPIARYVLRFDRRPNAAPGWPCSAKASACAENFCPRYLHDGAPRRHCPRPGALGRRGLLSDQTPAWTGLGRVHRRGLAALEPRLSAVARNPAAYRARRSIAARRNRQR